MNIKQRLTKIEATLNPPKPIPYEVVFLRPGEVPPPPRDRLFVIGVRDCSK